MRQRMLGVLGFALIAVAVAAPLEAQGRRAGGGGPSLDEQMIMLTERLELSEEQAGEVRTILDAQGTKRREMFQGGGGGGDRSAMRGQMTELQEETTVMLAEVLNETQMVEYAKIQEEQRGRRGPPIQ